jgi:acyl-CoA thioesterase
VSAEFDPDQGSLGGLLERLDVQLGGGGRFTGASISGEGGQRQVVEGSQLLAQAIVAVSKRLPDKSIHSAHAVFARVVAVGPTVQFDIDVVSTGKTTATAVVWVTQNSKRCAVVTVLADVPCADVMHHHLARPDVASHAAANPAEWPLAGVDLRLVDVVDAASPDEVGPPELYAWWEFDPVPTRNDLAKALIAYFTGHFGIATTMRAHEGIGMSQAHLTVSTAPLSTTVSFHEPVRWDGRVLYSHESTHVGAGMSYVRGAVHTEEGQLIASFVQEALIRPLRAADTAITSRARL